MPAGDLPADHDGRSNAPLRIIGVPSGAATWRGGVARAAAAASLVPSPGLLLCFTLRRRQFVDLDTLVEATVAGLRAAGVYRRGLADLDVVLATAGRSGETGADVGLGPAGPLRDRPPPGPARLEVGAETLPGTARAGKQAWRNAIAEAWDGAPLADGPVWAEVALARPGSILAPLEPILDALEPALGRDPRGRDWQEFFPADDRITWLRVLRTADPVAPLLRLRLGPAFHGGREGSP